MTIRIGDHTTDDVQVRSGPAMTMFGPTGKTVFERTYSRPLAEGGQEDYAQMSERVVDGNLGLVYGTRDTWSTEVERERERLLHYMSRFALLPAGRHLWASGVKGRQFLYNCHVSGWEGKFSDHFEFTFMRLMEGGGVGANYSSSFLRRFGAPRRALTVHVVCDPGHADYEAMKAAGVLSTKFDADWAGAYDVEDSREGWSEAMVDLLDTYMTDDAVQHADRVYDVSRVRPKGSRLKTFGGTASGPLPFGNMLVKMSDVMNSGYSLRVGTEALIAMGGTHLSEAHLSPTDAMLLDHFIAECVVSGGVRRSARMAQCHWKDPYIFEFIDAKADQANHWTTNISVVIDNEFIKALNGPEGQVRDDARAIHTAVVRGMLSNGEPGYWNHSLSNQGEVNEVISTNPCGEIALPAWGACVLGHVNLDAFAPGAKGGVADWTGMAEAHYLMTRFLIRATYGDMNDPKQKAVMDSERRIGVGHLGVQAFLVKTGMKYSEAPSSDGFRAILKSLRKGVRKAARDYAFALRIPEPVKVTALAPTGSISKLPGTTESAQAVLFRYFEQRVRYSLVDPAQAAMVEDFRAQGYTVEVDSYDASGNTAVVAFPTKHKLVEEVEALGYPADIVETQSELTMDQVLAFQAMYQECYVDNAISMTVNVPAQPHQQKSMLEQPLAPVPAPTDDYVTEVAETLARYLPKVKGTTVMVNGSRLQAPYTEISEADYLLQKMVLVGDGIDENCATGACPIR